MAVATAIDQLTVETMAANVLGTYQTASPEQKALGASWYFDANATAQDIGEAWGLSLETSAGIIAALSPRCNWKRNIYGAQVIASGGIPTGIFSRSINKALAIRQGMPAGLILSGPKESAFYGNIQDPWTSRAITVDYIGAGVAAGRRLTGPEVKALLGRRFGYFNVETAFRFAAETLKLPGLIVQATVWIVERGDHE